MVVVAVVAVVPAVKVFKVNIVVALVLWLSQQ